MARVVRDMACGRRAWVFASPAPHARLRLTDADGTQVPHEAEGLALRVAGMAINIELPVIVLGGAGGPLADAAFLGVHVPFSDGRLGALVVAGGHGLAARTTLARALADLAAAQVPAVARVGVR
jgi:hypothetical protein